MATLADQTIAALRSGHEELAALVVISARTT